MTQTWVPTWLGTLTLDAKDLTVVTNVFSLDGQATENPKPMMGSQYRGTSKGQITTSGSSSGFISAEKIADLWALLIDQTEVAAALQLGESLGATDAGDIGGNVVVLGLTLTGNEGGDVGFDMNWVFNEDATYTAA